VTFQKENGDWKELRQRFALRPEDEVDLHFGRRDPHVHYDEVVNDVTQLVEKRVREAHAKGRPYVLFVRGWSTSRGNNMTAQSVVRSFMRSSRATPYIDRRHSIQHPSVFLAKIKSDA
jgi:hypothetical protein